jgi:hypothetical protein
MGMFDTITVKCDLPDSFPKDKGPVFQTKDLDCIMLEYEIRENKQLFVKRCKYKAIDGNPDSESLFDRLPRYEEVSHEWEFYPYTGYIVFYTSIGEDHSKWVDYRAHLVGGFVMSISDFTTSTEGEIINPETMPVADAIVKTRELVTNLQKARDYYYDKLIADYKLGEDIEPYIFDFCYNDFGTIEKIKELL